MNSSRFAKSLSILALVTLLTMGCATQEKPPETTLAGIRENGAWVLTNNDQNRIAELQVGERLEIRLPENSTAGFSWAVDENDRRILRLDDTAYTPPEGVGFIGARGQRTFIFTARQPGELMLKLKYWRVFEGDDSVTERFAVTVRVVEPKKT